MKISTSIILAALCTAVLLSSCRTPPPTNYDRPLNSWKAKSGGINPGTRPGKHRL